MSGSDMVALAMSGSELGANMGTEVGTEIGRRYALCVTNIVLYHAVWDPGTLYGVHELRLGCAIGVLLTKRCVGQEEVEALAEEASASRVRGPPSLPFGYAMSGTHKRAGPVMPVMLFLP